MDNITFNAALFQQITPEQAWHYKIIPHAHNQGLFTFQIANNQDIATLGEELEMLLGTNIELLPTKEATILEALSKYYRKSFNTNQQQPAQQLAWSKTDDEDEEDFLDNLIKEAKSLGSSDIHIEPYEKHCRIRIRIDGLLVERFKVPLSRFPQLVNKIKIKAQLDISEKRLPQDGRIQYVSASNKFDIRVSSLPTLYGEKIVMRILNNDASMIDIRALGMKQADLENYLESVKKTSGIILISGPTGSGKTTTLYATLKLLNQTDKNILTIEDPIEYTLEGINQVQLKSSIGLDFTSAMRTFLRQDPDIIMVGEIRDEATADMAIRAALTGHLVLSTIHTNSALGIIARLQDMNVPSFLLADTLNIAVAQRLVRLLCKHCKEEIDFDANLLPKSFTMPYSIDKCAIAKGCSHCYFTGYQGRTALYEVIPINANIAHAIKNNRIHPEEIRTEMGIASLAQNAFQLLAQQQTAISEVYPILMSH